MTLKDNLTPKNTEEIKPGLFVQKNKDKYRVIEPIVWNGEWRLKNQFGWKNLFTIIIVLFLAFTYFNETSYCRTLQENPCSILENLTQHCSVTPQQTLSFNEKGYNFTLQGDP